MTERSRARAGGAHAKELAALGRRYVESWKDVAQAKSMGIDLLSGLTVAAVALPLNVGLAIAMVDLCRVRNLSRGQTGVRREVTQVDTLIGESPMQRDERRRIGHPDRAHLNAASIREHHFARACERQHGRRA